MTSPWLEQWFPLALVLGVGAAMSALLVVVATVLGPKRLTRVKEEPFECGSVAVGSARGRFSVKFYLVALLFIVFDVESVFVYPWAAQLRQFKAMGIGWFAFAEMMSFLLTVLVGLVYVWKKGALEW